MQERMLSVLPSANFWNRVLDNAFEKGKIDSFPDYCPMKAVEKENEYYLYAELPGLNMEDVEITCENAKLTVSVKKEEKKEENVIFNEMKHTSFARSFSIEGIDVDRISAKLKNGVLKVTLPKIEKLKPHKIKIS